MRLRLLFFLFLIFCVVLVLFTETAQGSPSPKKRKGSSGSVSKGSSSKGSNSVSSGSKKTSSSNKKSYKPYKSKASKTNKKSYKPYKSKASKKKFGKNVKKAAAVGVGLYVGSKVAKKLGKAFVKGIFPDYSFEQWRILANKDGWLCRNDRDCSWIDRNLGCDDRGFKISMAKNGWPWRAQLAGQCACADGFVFDKDEGSCVPDLSGLGGLLALGAGMIALVVIMSLVGCCCCCGIVFLIIKKLG